MYEGTFAASRRVTYRQLAFNPFSSSVDRQTGRGRTVHIRSESKVVE